MATSSTMVRRPVRWAVVAAVRVQIGQYVGKSGTETEMLFQAQTACQGLRRMCGGASGAGDPHRCRRGGQQRAGRAPGRPQSWVRATVNRGSASRRVRAHGVVTDQHEVPGTLFDQLVHPAESPRHGGGHRGIGEIDAEVVVRSVLGENGLADEQRGTGPGAATADSNARPTTAGYQHASRFLHAQGWDSPPWTAPPTRPMPGARFGDRVRRGRERGSQPPRRGGAAARADGRGGGSVTGDRWCDRGRSRRTGLTGLSLRAGPRPSGRRPAVGVNGSGSSAVSCPPSLPAVRRWPRPNQRSRCGRARPRSPRARAGPPRRRRHGRCAGSP